MRKHLIHFPSLFLILFLFSFMPSAHSSADIGTEICYDHFIESADPAGKPMILYTGRTIKELKKRSEADNESPVIGTLGKKALVQIWGFDQVWLFCWDEETGVYYIGRHNVDTIEPVSSDVPSYGVINHLFVASTACDTVLHAAPDSSSAVIDEYPCDTRMSLWFIRDGWAVIPYKRVVGYMHIGDLKDLTPVSPSVDYAQNGDILAAFTTFYSVKKTELNIGRMENIRMGCYYISKSYEPGEECDFNNTAGPYRQSRGYRPSPVLVNGGTVAGYGGGTCQVSTTLYNVLLQLKDGITVVYRRPHGPAGATYAPQGNDAAVGNEKLNLIFRNDFDFPVTIDCTAHEGALCIVMRKGRCADTSALMK